MSRSLHDQTIIVTGATSGIGRAIALSLATAGVTLGLTGRDASRLKTISAETREHAVRVESYRADLSCDEDIHHLVSEFKASLGVCDVLIHAAGIFRMGPISRASVEEFDSLFRINLRAPYLLTQALLPMISARRGQIVFVNSSAGTTARSGVGAYAASKFALRAIADSLRDEVNAFGVRVLSVYPGRTATPLQRKVREQEDLQYVPGQLLQPEDVASSILSALALPRTAEITDIHIRPMQKT